MIRTEIQAGKGRGAVRICSPAMLPVTFQFLIAMVAYAINERRARRLDYVQEEVRVLREALLAATGKKRIDFTVEQRKRLAVKGKTLTPDERQDCSVALSSRTARRREANASTPSIGT